MTLDSKPLTKTRYDDFRRDFMFLHFSYPFLRNRRIEAEKVKSFRLFRIDRRKHWEKKHTTLRLKVQSATQFGSSSVLGPSEVNGSTDWAEVTRSAGRQKKTHLHLASNESKSDCKRW